MARRGTHPRITQGDDGYWHAWVVVGKKPNGKLDRRHISRPTENEAIDRVDELLDQKRKGAVVRQGRAPTVQQWMETYLTTIAPSGGRCDPGTIRDYRSICTNWVYPVMGGTRIDQLQPEQLDQVYLQMHQAGRAASTVLKAHRILTRALEIAFRRGVASRNVAKLLDSPESRPVEQTPLDLAEALQVLNAAWALPRNGARWAVGLSLGLRQGEALGLRWSYLDLDRAEMRVWWQLRRRTFDHGCNPSCGRRRGGNCPARRMEIRSGEIPLEGGLLLKEPKGTGKRLVPLPTEVVALLRRHQAGQAIEQVLAGDLYVDHDLVFCQPDGRPIDPAADHKQWKGLCREAGVDEARLHDGRHTAGSMMLALGADISTVQEVLGHSDVRTTRGYVHVASEMARAATQRMGAALFGNQMHGKLHG
ncbi:site-specific integrase [Winogradskya consettensis]|uniref:Site-specific integrase n=1 Tax=Winogradskya consettensis TaxID=113560 RepID=A0A919W0Z9_9ACTN|nr:site-specific integrase [Actinoplanes consettensis]GIM82617.1 site-specific integrase [Actinoplanes consettensis]